MRIIIPKQEIDIEVIFDDNTISIIPILKRSVGRPKKAEAEQKYATKTVYCQNEGCPLTGREFKSGTGHPSF